MINRSRPPSRSIHITPSRIVAVLSLTFASVINQAVAIPFTLEYKVSFPFYVRYDFRLTLDNKDATWNPGSGYNAFVIGDVPYGYTSPSGLASPIDNISFRDLPASFFQATTRGVHNGPTLLSSKNDYFGWVPSAVGDHLDWFGLSPSWARDGEIYFAQLMVNGLNDSPWEANRFLAHQVTQFTIPPEIDLPPMASHSGH